jgi:hypothetical protein
VTRLRACAALAAALLSACDSSDPASSSAPGAGRAFTVATLPVVAGAPYSYAEPIAAIDQHGDAMVVASTANASVPPTLWLSRDHGDSWSLAPDFDSSGAGTGDADVAIGADGSLYALNLAGATPPAQPVNPTLLVYRSADGAHWTGPASFPVPHGLDQPDRPWLFTDPRDASRVGLLNSEGGGDIVLWRSTDGGASFAGPVLVTGGANGQAALALGSRPLVDPADGSHLYLLYETLAPGSTVEVVQGHLAEFPMTQIWLASSNDWGTSWSNRLVLDSSEGVVSHLLVATAIDASGELFAAYSLRRSGESATHIQLIHSADHGASWSAPWQVDTRLPSNMMPAIAVGPGRSLFLSWYGSDSTDFNDAQARWVEMFAETTDALAPTPVFHEQQISGAAPVHVGGIQVAGNPGFQLGENWGLRDLQSLVVDACGRPHPVWAVDNQVMATQVGVPAGHCAGLR